MPTRNLKVILNEKSPARGAQLTSAVQHSNTIKTNSYLSALIKAIDETAFIHSHAKTHVNDIVGL
jgi:hypothetical protein